MRPQVTASRVHDHGGRRVREAAHAGDPHAEGQEGLGQETAHGAREHHDAGLGVEPRSGGAKGLEHVREHRRSASLARAQIPKGQQEVTIPKARPCVERDDAATLSEAEPEATCLRQRSLEHERGTGDHARERLEVELEHGGGELGVMRADRGPASLEAHTPAHGAEVQVELDDATEHRALTSSILARDVERPSEDEVTASTLEAQGKGGRRGLRAFDREHRAGCYTGTRRPVDTEAAAGAFLIALTS